METWSKSSFLHTCAVFGTRQQVDCQRMFWNKISYAFEYPRFPDWIISKIIKLWGPTFFENVLNFMQILEMVKNFSGKFFLFKISVFELVAVFSGIMVRIRVRIPSIGRHWFNIQSWDWRSDENGRFLALPKLD